MKKLLVLLALAPMLAIGQSRNTTRALYQLKVYRYGTTAQGEALNSYLASAWVPALHRQGYKNVGVFSDLANDTSAVKSLYILVPFASLDKMMEVDRALEADKAFQSAGDAYINASPDQPPYTRMETMVLQAFRFAPQLAFPGLKGPKDQRVYELRSYESATEKKYANKVHMFNEGGEVPLFKRLDFNAVFYGEVVSGAKMPNLMYMTTFENMASREAHWKTFVDDPEWKTLSSKPEYQKNVSHADIIFLRPLPCSDY